MHCVIFPTWACQLHCEYCWLPHVKLNRAAQQRTWIEWANALLKILPPNSIVDVSGGDPFMFDGVVLLVKALAQAGMRWAIGTNALSTEGIEKLIEANPPHCACVNVSDHAGNGAASANVARLRSVFPVVIHRVNHPAAGHHLDDAANLIPYQDWKGHEAVDGVVRECTAGARHWIADPAGDVWRCIVDMQVGNAPFGNIFTGEFKKSISKRCAFGCSTCYTSEPAAWQIEMRAL